MDDATFWGITFAGVVSWQFHPGNRREKRDIDLQEAVETADRALVHFKARFPYGNDTD